ncbi:MAG: metallopeptidase family protein [Actinobacteria bacterium]|nr:metallopeptidase family protein [Actinomycetota bacterium]
MEPAAFKALVEEALDGLPEDISAHMSNVEVLVEEVPDSATSARFEDASTQLLGLYVGVPLTDRGTHYYGVLPDRISLYQRNIERSSDSLEGIRRTIKRTVIHEIAHHFGISDDRLAELGWA